MPVNTYLNCMSKFVGNQCRSETHVDLPEIVFKDRRFKYVKKQSKRIKISSSLGYKLSVYEVSYLFRAYFMSQVSFSMIYSLLELPLINEIYSSKFSYPASFPFFPFTKIYLAGNFNIEIREDCFFQRIVKAVCWWYSPIEFNSHSLLFSLFPIPLVSTSFASLNSPAISLPHHVLALITLVFAPSIAQIIVEISFKRNFSILILNSIAIFLRTCELPLKYYREISPQNCIAIDLVVLVELCGDFEISLFKDWQLILGGANIPLREVLQHGEDSILP